MTKHEQQLKNQQNQKVNSVAESSEGNHQQSQTFKSDLQTKKKIIKKFPFPSKVTPHINNALKTQDDLKDWKPTSISSVKNPSSEHGQNTTKKNSIFNTFLSTLPKPKQKSPDPQPTIFGNTQAKRPQKKAFIKPTQQELKWDQEDEFLTKKFNYEPQINPCSRTIPANAQKNELKGSLIVQENEEVVEKIVWLNQSKDKIKVKNLADIVSKTWQNEEKGNESHSEEEKNPQKNTFSKKFK